MKLQPAACTAGAEEERHRHRRERQHRFHRQVHMPGNQGQRQADGDDADEGRLLQDVEQDAHLEEIRNKQPEPTEHDDEDDPHEVVEHELDRTPARGGHRRAVSGLGGHLNGLQKHQPHLSAVSD
jgi:hypothetical protein